MKTYHYKAAKRVSKMVKGDHLNFANLTRVKLDEVIKASDAIGAEVRIGRFGIVNISA